MPYLFPVLCIVFLLLFMDQESKKKYFPAVSLKGTASVCFVLFGIFCSRSCPDPDFSRQIVTGLILGMVADVLLNLRFVFRKNGQLVFLAGILVFLSGHIAYLAALVPKCEHLAVCLIAGVVLTAAALYFIFKKITAKPAFRIFGVFYIGAVMIMTCVAAGRLIFSPSAHTAVFFIGALSFLVSDIVLILNTFGKTSKQSLRVLNLSLYYLGQLLIGLSLMLPGV